MTPGENVKALVDTADELGYGVVKITGAKIVLSPHDRPGITIIIRSFMLGADELRAVLARRQR